MAPQLSCGVSGPTALCENLHIVPEDHKENELANFDVSIRGAWIALPKFIHSFIRQIIEKVKIAYIHAYFVLRTPYTEYTRRRNIIYGTISTN